MGQGGKVKKSVKNHVKIILRWVKLCLSIINVTTGPEIMNICLISSIIDYLIGGNINTQPGLGVGLGVWLQAPVVGTPFLPYYYPAPTFRVKV